MRSFFAFPAFPTFPAFPSVIVVAVSGPRDVAESSPRDVAESSPRGVACRSRSRSSWATRVGELTSGSDGGLLSRLLPLLSRLMLLSRSLSFSCAESWRAGGRKEERVENMGAGGKDCYRNKQFAVNRHNTSTSEIGSVARGRK